MQEVTQTCTEWSKHARQLWNAADWRVRTAAVGAAACGGLISLLVLQGIRRAREVTRCMTPSRAGHAVVTETSEMRPMPAIQLDVRRVAVVGGCGSLGAAIVQLLLDTTSAEVVVLDVSPLPKELQALSRVQLKRCSITDAAQVREALAGVEVVFHVAAFIPAYSMRMSFQDTLPRAINFDGVVNVVQAAKSLGVRGLVYTSSVNAVQNEGDSNFFMDEKSVKYCTRPLSHYGRFKRDAEAYALANHTPARYDGMRVVAIRPPGMYGPRDRNLVQPVLDSGVVETMCSYGENVQDFCSVENAALAHVLAAARLMTDADAVGGKAYFISDGAPITMGEFSRLRSEVFRAKLMVPGPLAMMFTIAAVVEWLHWLTRGKFPAGRIAALTPPAVRMATCSYYANIAKANADLGYYPMHRTDQRLRELGVLYTPNVRK